MTDEKKIFLRIGAVVCAFEGELSADKIITQARITPILSEEGPTNFPSGNDIVGRTLPINLLKSVDQYFSLRSGKKEVEWDDIEIEGIGSRSDGKPVTVAHDVTEPLMLNSFGRRFVDGRNIGILSLEEKFFNKHIANIQTKHRWPYSNLEPYQCLTVLYKDEPKSPRAGRRYVGFKARLVSRDGSKFEIEILKSLPAERVQCRCIIDINDPSQCDFNIDLQKVLGLDIVKLDPDNNRNEGGIFLEIKHAASLNLEVDPKTPYYAGE